MPHNNNQSYEFGPYHLNPSQRVLTREGETISLTPKATELLIMLVANAGQLVGKEELLKEIWPDTFVEEANLTQNIFLLRRALSEERGGPKYIETVARRGYRFVAHVTVVGPDERPAQGSPSAAEALVVAVLPLINATGDSELEYLADGLTDNLINNLSRVSQLRVMSHSAAFRYKRQEVDPQRVGKELHASAVLVGKIKARRVGIVISAELVDVSTGWQLWGESFDSATRDLLEIQDAITRHLLAALKLKLTGEEEQRVTARYTENAAAYQAYLEGRYHWSRYTRKGIEKAIKHFRHAIELDPNYALAYAAIVDCYLRLATNYLPPEDDLPMPKRDVGHQLGVATDLDPSESRVRLRFEWDWKGAERELRRALELKTNYPTAHQWYAAYQLSKRLYEESRGLKKRVTESKSDRSLVPQIPFSQLTRTEEIQILSSVAREQLAAGNYEAARLVMRDWFSDGKWPRLHDLSTAAAGDLLFTLGILLGYLASSNSVVHGHKQAEVFLSGAVALFEQLGMKNRSVEARIELARCFYRQGFFDIARRILSEALSELPDDEVELKNVGLAVWGAVERESGRLIDSLIKLREATNLEVTGDLITARFCHELALTLKDLASLGGVDEHAKEAKIHFQRTLYICEAVGYHRLAAAVENNFGFLLLQLGDLAEAEQHLLRSKRLFECFADSIRGAQLNETLASLYIEKGEYVLAREVIESAVAALELTDGEAALAEALRTAGVVAARQARFGDARKSFEAAYKVAERCGDQEGAGRALLIMFEEMSVRLDKLERVGIVEKLTKLLAETQQTALQARVKHCVEQVTLEAENRDSKRHD